MTDYIQEQEMEIEALEAILADDFKEIHSGENGLNTSTRCFQIKVSPVDDEADEFTTNPVQLALIFSHTERYPDEPPLLNLNSLRCIQGEHLRILKEKLLQEASENLGMAMIYTLVTSAKEWLSEQYCQDTSLEDAEAEEAAKDDVIIPHGEPVTVETFLAWREMFEAELALERAKLMPDAALSAPKEKRLTGRQWFETGRHAVLQPLKGPMKRMRMRLTSILMILKMTKMICWNTIWLRSPTHQPTLRRGSITRSKNN
ncbi:RWD domain-containing protein 1-like isoform X1 [Pyrus x bretschneideri]|uniref:RWD domain-containing protein 1-like isoform X1 n=1 Tax=Pyrus x bretschneideri TaxID=225117 RepID=UPI002030253C|nr:RWD domain-containing protein 1-like isoform X1 [Pyrus x bretschneideri]